MNSFTDRRAFLRHALTTGPIAAAWLGRMCSGDEAEVGGEFPPATVIAGAPRDRGRLYGRTFRDGIRRFLDQEINRSFVDKPSTREELIRYAGACGGVVRDFSPEIHDELEGIAEGADLGLEEVVLITLHEEIYHRGVLPKVEHCTAIAVGPPDTRDGHTYVGQTWDWMRSVFGWSSLLHWKRTGGPSLLAYAFPGLWVGAGLNEAGLALCWTSADLGNRALEVRVGVPSYVLLAQLLYQETLHDAISEARRATNAGWFTFVMADDRGHLVNIEGSPEGLTIEPATGRLARVGFGTRRMTGTAEGEEIPVHPRCRAMNTLLERSAGRIDRRAIQEFFDEPEHGISVGKATIDMMVFDTAAREAHLSRGPSYRVAWKQFGFQ